MADERFYLRFENDPAPVDMEMGAEFIGWDKAKLMMKQRDNAFGRDESFDASEAEYAPERGHHFDKLQQAFDQHSFEMNVVQGIEADGRTIEYNLDGGGTETNEVDYLRSPLIQNSQYQLLKDRMDTKINVFSDTTLDGEPIDPLITENILYYAYPTTDVSSWKTSAPDSRISYAAYTKTAAPATYNGLMVYQNTANVAVQYDIKNSLGSLFPYVGVSTLQPPQGFFPVPTQEALVYIEAQDTIYDLKIELTNIDYKVRNEINESGIGAFDGGSAEGSTARTSLVYRIGEDIGSSVRHEVYGKYFGDTEEPEYTFPSSFAFTIPILNRNERLYIYFENVIWGEFEPTNPGEQVLNYQYYQLFSTLTNVDIKITGTQVSYNTIVPMIRLVDVMRYWVKSACGLDIDAPRFESGGEFYPLRLSNGNLFRLKKDEPFYITGKMIMDSIFNQFLADYELNWSGLSVFFGIYEDFYRDVEIAFFDSRQFMDFTKTVNPRFAVNDVKVKFSKYESQRENTEANTVDEVHGEYEGLAPNKKAKNTYERVIEWVMSARTLERNRRAAIEETSTTATNDDDTLFCIDVNDEAIENTNAFTFTETSFLQHTYDPDLGNLTLRNDGSFSWVALGIVINQPFAITTIPAQLNQGTYNVLSVSDSQLVLFPIGGSPSSANDGERNTRYTYLVPTSTLDGVTWTDQDLTVSGLANADKYPNLRWSLGQSIDKYHKRYLASIALNHPNDYLRTTFYKNNPNAEINGKREGGQILTGYPEGSIDTRPQSANPILSTALFKNVMFVGNETTLAKWDTLAEYIRTVRGFIRFIDNNGIVRKFFSKIGGFSVYDDAIVFDEGEEKFEPFIINIWKEGDFVHINNEYQVTQLNYKAIGLKYRIMDRENELLYNPIWWHRIYVNGQKPESQNQLEEWLISL